jgi:quinol monooxygenase YgiN
MLIVAGTFEVDPARRDEFLQGRHDAMVTARGERGCLEYVFSADPLLPGRVVLFEIWEDQDCLTAHLEASRSTAAAAKAAAGSEKPAPGPVVSSVITRYEISASEPL